MAKSLRSILATPSCSADIQPKNIREISGAVLLFVLAILLDAVCDFVGLAPVRARANSRVAVKAGWDLCRQQKELATAMWNME